MKTANLRKRLFIVAVMAFFGTFATVSEQGCASGLADRQPDWQYHSIGTTNQPRALYGADIDGDGGNDAIVASSDWDQDNEVAWFENHGDCNHSWTHHVTAALPSPTWLNDVFAIDLDGDKDVDVITTAVAGDMLVWYENQGGDPPAWTAHVIRQAKGGLKGWAASVFAADMDGDGDIDIVWGGTDVLSWYENDGDSPPNFLNEHVIPSNLFLNGGTSVFVADLDNDTDVDIVLGGTGHGELAWYENPSWTERIIDTSPSNIWRASGADFDGDNDVDILADSYWYENDGGSPPSFTSHLVGSVTWSHPADLDNDGHVDVVGIKSPGEVYWYENDGSSPPSWTEYLLHTPPSPANFVLPMDVDMDTDIDILIANTADGFIGWLENLFVYEEAFRIIEVTDVGNDQGRQVRVKWNHNCNDRAGQPYTIPEYGIWRRIDQDKNTGSGDEGWFPAPAQIIDAGRIYPPGDWDFIRAVPARGEWFYNAVCPTLGDYTEDEGIYWSVFFVSAMTPDPLVYFDTDPDSGYSIDNIPPTGVKDLDIPRNVNSTLIVTWTVPGEYPGEESATGCDIRYHTTPVGLDTASWWANATQCAGEPYPAPAGAIDSFMVTLDLAYDYYFAMKLSDDRPNYSEISNIASFIRGDATGDGVIDVADIVYLVNYLYRGGDPPHPDEAGDANCDGIVNVADVVRLVNYLYKGGDPPGC